MKMPKTLYVKIDTDGKDEYFITDENLEGQAVMGEKIMVGVYELKDTLIVETTIITKSK